MTSISSFSITQSPLLNLLQDIKSGKIQVADFQRSWCWDEERITRLLASVSLGFPVGAIMLVEQSHSDVKFKPRLVEGVNLGHPPVPTALILDGLQRFTSLFLSLLSDQPVRLDRGKRYPPEKHWYYINIEQALKYPSNKRHEAIMGFSIDEALYPDGEILVDSETREIEADLGLFPLFQVFNFPEWRSHYCKCWQDNPQKLAMIDEFEATVIRNFEQYQMGVLLLSAQLPKESIYYIFEENNKRHSQVTEFDGLTASFAAKGFDLRSDWIARERRFNSHPVLRQLRSMDFLQAIALMANLSQRAQVPSPGSHTEEIPKVARNRQDVLHLDLAEYQQWMEPLTIAFEQVAHFLRNQAIYEPNDLPYPMQLVVMAPLFAILGEQVKLNWVYQLLKQWFYCAIVSGSYSRLREAVATKDLLEVPQWINGGEVPSSIREAHLSAQQLQSIVNAGSPIYRTLTAFLRCDVALDFLTGEPIPRSLRSDPKIENHHIFPQQWCKQQGIPPSRYNSIINRTPLTAQTNNWLGGVAPSEYLTYLEGHGMSAQRIEEILRSHLIEPATLYNDDFDAFFEARTQAILARFGRAMGKDELGDN
ncbi:DUF262 domain-containing protein [Trichocoleus sp. ST-U3]